MVKIAQVAGVIKNSLASTAQIVTDKAGNAMHLLADLVTKGTGAGIFSHDKASDIECIITILMRLTKKDEKFTVLAKKPSILSLQTKELWNHASLEDYLTLLKSITGDKSRELFNTTIRASTDYYVFEELMEHLEAAITAYKTLPALAQIEAIKLPDALIASVHPVIGRLTHLKISTAGYFTKTRHQAKAHESLYSFYSKIEKLQKELIIPSSTKKLVECGAELIDEYDNIVKNEQTVFRGQKLSKEDKENIEALSEILDSHASIPEILRNDPRFIPNSGMVLEKLQKISDKITDTISSQEGTLTKLSQTGKEAISEFTAKMLQFREKKDTIFHDEHTTIFHILKEALNSYFFKPSINLSHRQELLDDLLNDCERAKPGFKKSFLSALEKEHLTLENFLTQKTPVTKEKGISVFNAALHGSFDKEKEKTPEVILEDIQKESKTVNAAQAEANAQKAQNENGNPLLKYAQDAIDYLSSFKSFLPNKSLSLIGSTFFSLLSNEKLESWLNAQDAGDKAIFKAILDKAKAELEPILASQEIKMDQLLAVFQNFKKALSEKQIILDAFVMPSLFGLEKVDNPQDTLRELRNQYVTATYKEPEKIDWKQKYNEKSQEFITNMRDYSVFNAVYGFFKSTPKENSEIFAAIIARINALEDPSLRRKTFIAELRKVIDRHTESSFFKRLLVKTFLPLAYTFITYYIDKSSASILDYVQTQVEELDRDNQRSGVKKLQLVHHFSDAASLYANMLTDWGKKQGEKSIVIEDLLKQPEYNNKLSQDEIYRRFIEKAINKFFVGSSFAKELFPSFSQIKRWVTRPIVSETNILAKGFNLPFKIAKAVLGTCALVVSTAGYILTSITEVITNALIKRSLKKYCHKTNIVETLVLSTRNSIYGKNPYVHSITKFILEQLEILSKKLEDDEAARKLGNIEEEETVEISEKTKQALTSALRNYFKALKLDKCEIADDVEKVLHDKDFIKVLSEKVDAALLPSILDSIINVSVLGSRELLEKNSLHNSLFQLFDQMNDALVTPEKEQTAEEAAQANQVAFETEKELNQMLDKILKQVVKKAVDGSIDSYGNKSKRESENVIKWMQKELLGSDAEHPGLTQNIRLILDAYKVDKAKSAESEEEDLKKLETHKETIANFIEILKKQISRFEKEVNDRTIVEFRKKANLLVKAFESVMDKDHFLKIYTNQRKIEEIKHDRVATEKLRTSFSNLHTVLTSPVSKDELTRLGANLTTIKFTLEKLSPEYKGEDAIHLKGSNDVYKDLKEKLVPAKFIQRLEPAAEHYEAVSQSILELRKLREDAFFTDFTKFKNEVLEESKHYGLHTFISSDKRKKLIKEYNKLLSSLILKRVPFGREILSSCLYDMTYAKTIAAFNASKAKFQAQLDVYLGNEETQLQTAITKATTIEAEASTIMQEIETKLNGTLDASLTDNENVKLATQNALTALEEETRSLSTIAFVTANVGIVDSLKTYAYKAVYGTLKDKVSLNLIRNGTFAQTVANNFLGAYVKND